MIQDSQGIYSHIYSFNQYSLINNSQIFIYKPDHCQLLDLSQRLYTGHFHLHVT